MDTFKLLTRSTKIQKAAPLAKKTQRQKIPSSVGDVGQAQRAELTIVPNNPAPRGTKRKRGVHLEKDASTATGGLNYFEKTTQASAPEQPSEHKDHAPRRDSALPDGQVLEEGERRKILKQNKLKVTLLQADLLEASATDRASQKHIVRTQLFPQPLMSFKQLRERYGVSRRLAENLDAQGYIKPTEVQIGSLPLLLGTDGDRGMATNSSKKSEKRPSSHVDLLTVAPTGSGKTLAFMVYLLNGLIEERRRRKGSNSENGDEHGLQALMIAPTHELADQIVNEGRKMATGTGIKISAMRKGMVVDADTTSLNAGIPIIPKGSYGEIHEMQNLPPIVKADIIVSTPGLLLNALKNDPASTMRLLPTVRYLVLDEADVLLDPLFRSQTLEIWHACNNADLQVSLWSATIGSSVESLAQETILERRRDLKLSASSHHLIRVVVGLKDSAIPNISHRLTYAATEHGKLLALRQLVHPSAPADHQGPTLQPPFLIFTQTIQRAIALHSELLYDIPPEAGGSSRIAVLHSDLSDNARSAIMAGFRKGEIWVLITTDLLSRGIDFRGMNGVVNYDIPNTGASYVHRVGRTGRQGREGGVAVTLYTKEDIPYVKNIANVIAASEKAKGMPKGSEGDMQAWLLNALPSVSKKAKQELKKRGVKSRRTFEGKEGGKEARRARISTKSGYDRKLENRRKLSGVPGPVKYESLDKDTDSDEEWAGLDS